MLRATHFPPISSPALLALRKCFIPNLSVSSFPSYPLHNLSSFSAFHSFFSPSRPSLPSLSLTQFSPMLGHPHLRLSGWSFLFLSKPMFLLLFSDLVFAFAASFNSESSYGDNREILVQHLLLKEDDQKLLLELQQRIAGGFLFPFCFFFKKFYLMNT